MKPIYNILVLVFVLCGVQLFSQQIVPIEFSPKLNQSDVNKIRPLLTKLLEDYQRYARLYDDELGSNNDAVNKFVDLFQIQESEIVFGDFFLEPSSTEFYKPLDYANEALARGYSGGIDFQIVSISIPPNGIVFNDYGYYEVTAKISKKIMNPYDNTDGIILSEEFVPLEFLTAIDPEDQDKPAAILSIRNTREYTLKEQPKKYIAPMIGIGTGLNSLTFSDYWNENAAGRASLDVKSGLQISVGVDWLFTTGLKKNAAKQRWGIIVGLQGNYSTYKSELTNMRTPVFRETVTGAPNEASTTFDSWTTVVVLDETTRMFTGDVKVGVGWRATFNQQETNSDINNKIKNYLWFNFKVIPSFGLYNIVTADGLATYDGIATEENAASPSELRFLGNNAIEDLEDSEWRFYGRGKNLDVAGNTSAVPMSSVGLKFELSPTWYFDNTTYNESPTKWDFAIGLDLGYQLKSNFKHNNVVNVSDDSYRNKNDVTNSVINSYTSSLSGPYLLFRIGINRRNQRY